jgi:hypothetical protein
MQEWLYQVAEYNASISNPFSGGFGPLSANHWSNQYRSEYLNNIYLSRSSFDNFYGAGSSRIADYIWSDANLLDQWRNGDLSIQEIKEKGGVWVDSYKITPVRLTYYNVNGKFIGCYEGGTEIVSTWVPFVNYGQAGGGDDKIISSINTIASVISLTTGAVSNTLRLTEIGSDIAYFLSNSKFFLTSVEYLKPVGYWASGLTVATDIIQSTTGQQSWTETGFNTAVTGIAIGVGGWPGLIIQLDYIGAKTYMRTLNEHPDWVLPASYHSFMH